MMMERKARRDGMEYVLRGGETLKSVSAKKKKFPN